MKSQLKYTIAIAAALGTAHVAAIDPYVEPKDPYLKPDGSWISISGTVVAPTADSFTLDYGSGVILVEMDDWDKFGEALALLDGDKVTVYGAIDDDLYEISKIEAGSVWVENLNTYFYANSADEEDAPHAPYVWYTMAPVDMGYVTVRGTVTGVNKSEHGFTLDSEMTELSIDASQIGYNAFDDLGFQKIEQGDVVSVTGKIDYEFIGGRELNATSVVTLFDAKN